MILTLLLFAALVPSSNAHGDESGESTDLVNYAFAIQLGTGKYSVSGRSVNVYRAPISYSPRRIETHPWGMTLTLTGAIGLFDFEAPDIIQSGAPDVQTLSLVPAVKLVFKARRNWVISPFAGLGGGKDFSGGDFTYIYMAGVGNLLTFFPGAIQLRVGNTSLYTGYFARETHLTDDFMELRTGVDIVNPLTFSIGGRKLNAGLFTINYLYLNDLEFRQVQDEVFKVDLQQEIGVTVGAEKPLRLWLLKVSRLGVGFRFGDDLRAIRLMLGNPF
jgi:hypothetical protein